MQNLSGPPTQNHSGVDKAVFVGHRDTEHPHIHIILNRVHPEHGLALDEKFERVRASAWAREYEKEHGRVWCEGRLDPSNDNTRDLPHEVIEMARPKEKEFLSTEARREALDKHERDLLKAQQRKEREAFFEQGRKVFKELRDAVYREVRENYKHDWRTFFKEKAEAEKLAKELAAAETARAFQEGKAGNWETARTLFDRREQRLDDVRHDFAERARDLRAAQIAETRECQDMAIKVLREQRDQDYLDLKRHQQDERDELREAHAAGERADDLLKRSYTGFKANDNHEPAFPGPPPVADRNDPNGKEQARPARAPPPEKTVDEILNFGAGPEQHAEPQQGDADKGREPPPEEPREPEAATRDAPEPIKSGADLGAGAIGSVASYLADQLAELFAPTPPEVREARAKAEAKREAEKPVTDDKDKNPFARYAEAAIKRAEAENERARDRDYWDDRERRRER